MRSEQGELWLKPEEWIPWLMANHPERIRDREALARALLGRVFEDEAARLTLMRSLSNPQLTKLVDQLATDSSPHAPRIIAEAQAILGQRKEPTP